jgi:hypothetical protein
MEEKIIDLTFNEIGCNQIAVLLEEIENCSRCQRLYHSISETLFLADQAGEAMMPKEDYWSEYDRKLSSIIVREIQPEYTADGKKIDDISHPVRRPPSAVRRLLNIFTSLPAPVIAGLILIVLAGCFWYVLTSNNRLDGNPPGIALKEPKKEKAGFAEPLLPNNDPEPLSGKSDKFPRSSYEPKRKERVIESIESRSSDSIKPEEKSVKFEMALHFEDVQMLLRSIRNACSSDKITDLSFEKRLSRELLDKNMVFRHEAENNGDPVSEELLSSVEILLIDISNLPDRASQNDLRIIKNVLQKEKIIATLQPYAAPYSE